MLLVRSQKGHLDCKNLLQQPQHVLLWGQCSPLWSSPTCINSTKESQIKQILLLLLLLKI